MITMRKSIMIFLCLVLACIVCIENNSISYASSDTEYKKEVRGKVEEQSTGPPVYSVDVTWGAMEFTYSKVGTRKWNETTHEYNDIYTSSWKANGNIIKVTNHSNIGVQAKFAYSSSNSYSTVSGYFNSSQAVSLPSAENKSMNSTELTGSRQLMLKGTLQDGIDNYTTVGTIKIEID